MSSGEQTGAWVRRKGGPACFDLWAPDGQLIATFPVNAYGGGLIGLAGKRWVRAEAGIRDGTGTLFLNEEDGDFAIYEDGDIATVAAARGPRLATYRQSWIDTRSRLEFPDGQVFRWFRWGKDGKGTWTDETLTTEYAVIHYNRTDRYPVDILPPAAGIPPPRLSLLLVLGIYNIQVENFSRMTEDTKTAEFLEVMEDIKRFRRWLRKRRGG